MISMMGRLKRRRQYFFPPNPDQVILKNEYYPQGLTEKQVYEHYMKYKPYILEHTQGREIMFAIKTDDDIVIKRKDSNGRFLKLNNNNYEDLITGRTIAVYATMGKTEKFGIIDIDTNHFGFAKGSAAKIYDGFPELGQIAKKEIRFTGKTSFHIILEFKQNKNINSIRSHLRQTLKNNFDHHFAIEKKRSTDKINLDLSPNKFRGAYIIPGALSVEGLKCMTVKRSEILSFQKSFAKVK